MEGLQNGCAGQQQQQQLRKCEIQGRLLNFRSGQWLDFVQNQEGQKINSFLLIFKVLVNCF